MKDPSGKDPLFDQVREANERDKLARLARRLERERPVPRPGFRGSLGRSLTRQLEPHRAPSRRLGVLIGAYTGSGLALLAVAALGLVGAGPLAA